MTTLYRFSASTLSGREQSLSEYRGKLLLVVNTASKCGFTPQFAGLERLYSTHSADGLEVLGFPCDQFAGQEFDDAAQIASASWGMRVMRPSSVSSTVQSWV